MAGSLNKVCILGNLGGDPEIRRTNDGRSIANFTVATSETWRDKNTGDKKEKTEWHKVVVFNEGLAGVAEKYLSKGSKVYVEGQLQTRMWEKDGHKNYSTEIVLQGFGSQLILLGSKDDAGGGGRRDDRRDDRQPARNTGGGGGFSRDMDDEIPFSPEWRV